MKTSNVSFKLFLKSVLRWISMGCTVLLMSVTVMFMTFLRVNAATFEQISQKVANGGDCTSILYKYSSPVAKTCAVHLIGDCTTVSFKYQTSTSTDCGYSVIIETPDVKDKEKDKDKVKDSLLAELGNETKNNDADKNKKEKANIEIPTSTTVEAEEKIAKAKKEKEAQEIKKTQEIKKAEETKKTEIAKKESTKEISIPAAKTVQIPTDTKSSVNVISMLTKVSNDDKSKASKASDTKKKTVSAAVEEYTAQLKSIRNIEEEKPSKKSSSKSIQVTSYKSKKRR